jgi:hypothetical protein
MKTKRVALTPFHRIRRLFLCSTSGPKNQHLGSNKADVAFRRDKRHKPHLSNWGFVMLLAAEHPGSFFGGEIVTVPLWLQSSLGSVAASRALACGCPGASSGNAAISVRHFTPQKVSSIGPTRPPEPAGTTMRWHWPPLPTRVDSRSSVVGTIIDALPGVNVRWWGVL